MSFTYAYTPKFLYFVNISIFTTQGKTFDVLTKFLQFVNISIFTNTVTIVTPTKKPGLVPNADHIRSPTNTPRRVKRLLCRTHFLPFILPWLDSETLTALDKALTDSVSRRYLENCTVTAIKNLQNENLNYSHMQKRDFLFSKNIPLRWSRKSWLNDSRRHQNGRNYISDKCFKSILDQSVAFSTPIRDYIHLREGPSTKIPFSLCAGPGLYRNNHRRDDTMFDLLFQGHLPGSSIAICHSLSHMRYQYISFSLTDIDSKTFIHDNLFQYGSVGVGVIRPLNQFECRSNLDLTKSFDMRQMKTVVDTLPYYKSSRIACAHRCPDMVFITPTDTSSAPYKDVHYTSAVIRTYHDTLTRTNGSYNPISEWCTEYGLLLDKDRGTLSLFNHGISQNLVIEGLHGEYNFFIQVEGCPGSRLSTYGKPEFRIKATTFR